MRVTPTGKSKTTSGLYTRRLMRKMLVSSIIFLTLSGCATAQHDTKFDGKWEACEVAPQRTVMCLEEPDILKLREILVRCGAEK